MDSETNDRAKKTETKQESLYVPYKPPPPLPQRELEGIHRFSEEIDGWLVSMGF